MVTVLFSGAWLVCKHLFCLWGCSQRNESRSKSRFGMWFGPFPDLKAWFYPLWTQSSFKSGFWNTKKGAFWIRDPRRKPDSEDMWTQSSFGMWFVRVHFGNARWSHAWVNQHGLRSRNKILPHSAQILFVIGMAFAMLVNAHVVQITNPIRKRIAIRNGFRNVIRSFVIQALCFTVCLFQELMIFTLLAAYIEGSNFLTFVAYIVITH